MKNVRLSMRKIKKLLRLRFECGLVVRQIARSIRASHSTVLDYLYRAQQVGRNCPLSADMEEKKLGGVPMRSSKQRRNKTLQHIRSKLLIEYLKFLRCYQRLSEATIRIRRNYVSRFLAAIKGYGTSSKIGSISPSTIHDYIIKTAKPINRAGRKHFASSLRSFLRFIHVKGYIAKNLLEAVPVIATRKLDRLPRALSWENV